MKVLLDTHILIWALEDDSRLSEQARLIITDPTNRVFNSVASSWVISIKHMSHPDKMLINGTEFMDLCECANYEQLAITGRHVKALETLVRPDGIAPHNDPFDRIMLAQAKAEGMMFLTHDSRLAEYGEPCVIGV